MRASEFVNKKSVGEDQHPNDTPRGPEFKPTMPAGTVRVDVSDVYDWYKLGQHISNLKGLGHHDFGQGPPSTIFSFGSEDEEHKYIKDLEKTGLTTTDIDPADPKQPKGMPRQKVDPTYNVAENFELSDAVVFHNQLNNKLFVKGKMIPEVKQQLIVIAKDFLKELGIKTLDIEDITVSGSNAAYSYTPYSDLDLHILVDMDKLANDELYKEFFSAKKTIYNDTHDITINDIPIELYVQDSAQPHVSLGEYSVLKDKWLRKPTREKANFDQTNTKLKYAKLLQLIKSALNSKNSTKILSTIDKLKQYRKAGLDKTGEFGPENLAYKALRNQGYIEKLFNLKNQVHSNQLSMDENFADGRNPGRKGLSQRVGIPKGASIAQLEKLKSAPGEKGRMARWQLNMRRGKNRAGSKN